MLNLSKKDTLYFDAISKRAQLLDMHAHLVRCVKLSNSALGKLQKLAEADSSLRPLQRRMFLLALKCNSALAQSQTELKTINKIIEDLT